MHKIVGHWHQSPYEKFQAPEFYDNGLVVKVISGSHAIDVYRDGEAVLQYSHQGSERYIVDYRDFRETFYDGILPDDDDFYTWDRNGWFDLYDSNTGEHLDEIRFTWQEAFDAAVEILDQYDKEKSNA